MSDIKKRFLYLESYQIPLKEIPFEEVKELTIDPTTGLPYKGMILEGIFAVLKPEPNNNNRLYDIPEYLRLLQILKKQIFSPKGVYGEYEHPKGYAINHNNVSHKLLDVWYNEEEQTVYGRILILNNEKGKLAQEIIKSGGQLAISARAAGEEIKNSDGTFRAVTKILTTFDLVYHPGFSQAVLEFKQLNESQRFIQTISETKKGFSTKIYESDFKKLDKLYSKYIQMNESDKCFLEWYSLYESSKKTDQEKIDEQKLESKKTGEENKAQNKLKVATDQDLKQSAFFQEISISQKKLRKKQGNSFYDNSAGFILNQARK